MRGKPQHGVSLGDTELIAKTRRVEGSRRRQCNFPICDFHSCMSRSSYGDHALHHVLPESLLSRVLSSFVSSLMFVTGGDRSQMVPPVYQFIVK